MINNKQIKSLSNRHEILNTGNDDEDYLSEEHIDLAKYNYLYQDNFNNDDNDDYD